MAHGSMASCIHGMAETKRTKTVPVHAVPF
jgi:hypothetical protein